MAEIEISQQKPPVLVLLDLARRARHAEDGKTLEFILLNETYALVPFTLAALWVSNEGVVAQSGVSQPDPHSAFILWLSKICQTAAQFSEPTILVPSLFAQEDVKEWSSALPAQVVWFPLNHQGAKSSGLLICRNEDWTDQDIGLISEWSDIWKHAWHKLYAPSVSGELSNLLSKLSGPTGLLGQVFAGVSRLAKAFNFIAINYLIKPHQWPAGILLMSRALFCSMKQGLSWLNINGFNGLTKLLFSELIACWTKKRRRYFIIFLIIALLPVRLTILAPGEIVPLNPSVIRVPIEGVVDEFFVTPNQKVAKDQPLFKLDLTTLSSKLEVAQQEMQVADTEYRQSSLQSLNDAKSRGLLVPQEGKAMERQLEADYQKEMLEKAKIKAPANGVVLFDDPSVWIGKPVVAGEKVMVVANENHVEIEAWVPMNEAIELPTNASLTLYLNASPFSPVNAHVRYFGYEAIQRPDGAYAYRLRATLNDDQELARIGLKGTAKISGEYVPLSYWIFRKPLAFLRQFFGV